MCQKNIDIQLKSLCRVVDQKQTIILPLTLHAQNVNYILCWHILIGEITASREP